jgi:diguanylate cyclase (GGDEF)-like protein/PAS domain S-box-containing protein
MQNGLLDILIIGCLVLLFASTYRKRATFTVRCWSIGWLLILVHFAATLYVPRSEMWQDVLQLVSIAGLIACGVLFLLPTGSITERRTLRNLAVPLIPAFTSMTIALLLTLNVTAKTPYFALIAAGEFGAVVYVFRFHGKKRRNLALLLLSIAAGTSWLLWTVIYGHEEIALSAILAQIYLTVAIVYLDHFRRISAGMLTVCVGLFAWALVFPAGEFCDHLHIQNISPELWNIPKYFVAFGMMLTLLEDEILAAGAASRNFRLLFEGNPHPMWIYDRNTLAFDSVNEAAVKHYGYSKEQFLKMTLADIRPTEDLETVKKELQEAEPAQPLTGPWRHQKRDGSFMQVDIACHHLESDGRPLAFSLMQDVTERQKMHEQLVHQANHDILTGLPNRALLETRIQQTLAHAERHGRKAALLCLDVDRFKQINDTYGHSVGDECLKEIARRLASRVRPLDTVARAGGEEFSVLLHEITDLSDAEQVAADLLESLRQPFRTDGFSLEFSASIGIAVYPKDGQDHEILWRNADCAMYRAKHSGGAQYLSMSHEISVLASEANEIELHLRRALKGEGLMLHYQPIFCADGELCSLEALVRLQHPDLGLIAPGKFIPLAEEIGLIIPIGNWVLNEVCRQSTAWRNSGLPAVMMGLNVSPLQLNRFDFASHVVDVLKHYDMGPELLGIEVTETTVMRNISDASRQIETLAQMGIEFSVDDFGTGYSSLGHLHRLPVQTLKIDRSFIERITEPNGTYSIVQAIIFLAHSLRLKVVAEGVEREDQLACLQELECDMYQGYLFSPPLPAAAIATLLRDGRRTPLNMKKAAVPILSNGSSNGSLKKVRQLA